MRLAHASYKADAVFLTEMLGIKGTANEFNIIPNPWNATVTSRVPISGVASQPTRVRSRAATAMLLHLVQGRRPELTLQRL